MFSRIIVFAQKWFYNSALKIKFVCELESGIQLCVSVKQRIPIWVRLFSLESSPNVQISELWKMMRVLRVAVASIESWN